jgi:hypothetical protein
MAGIIAPPGMCSALDIPNHLAHVLSPVCLSGYVTSLNVPIYLGKAAANNPDLDSRLLNVFLQFERIAEVGAVLLLCSSISVVLIT